MMRLEEYIKKRKHDERLDEFDLSKKSVYMQQCVGYVLEYFNNYLDVDNYHQELRELDSKTTKFRKTILDYSPDVQDNLIQYYQKYQMRLNERLDKQLRMNDIFLLVNDDSHFRKFSYMTFSKLDKKCPGLNDNVDFLFELIKDYHRVESQNYFLDTDSYKYNDFLGLPPNFQEYVEIVIEKYRVNLLAWAENYVMYFYEDPHRWPLAHTLKDKLSKYDDYDYKAKKNTFNIDIIFPQVSSLPYLKGKKKFLEYLLKYYWHNEIERFDDNYLRDFMQEMENFKI